MTNTTVAPAKALRTAIYTRISDDAEGDGEGVGRQKADCLKRAAHEGWHMVKIFEENDTGASRHSKKPRPQYRQMIEMARRGEIDVIVAYSNSRLTRRMSDFEELAELVEKRGVKIRTIVSGDDDLSTADGLMVARIKASVDAAEADRTSERVRRAQAVKMERGDWLGGFRPFGWGWTETINGRRVDHDVNKLNPQEAELIRAGVKHVLEGGSIGALIRQWNDAGVQTSRGSVWRHMSVNRVLTRWRNAGVLEYDGKPRPEIDAPFAAILTAQEVEQLRAILSDPKRSLNGARGYAPKHMLSGIAVCGRCGNVLKSGAVYGRTTAAGDKRARYGMYRCSGKDCYLAIHIDTTDELVSRRMVQAYVHGGPGQFAAAREETAEALGSAHRALAEVLADRAQWVGMIGDNLISPGELRPKLAELTAREDQLREDIARVHREDAHSAMTAAALSAFVHEVRPDGMLSTKLPFENVDAVIEKWNGMELDARRRLIRALITVTVLPAEGRARADRIVIGRVEEGRA